MSLWSRPGYLLATAVPAAAAVALLAVLEVGQLPAVALGVGSAWVIQAPAYWTLAGALSREKDVLRIWAGGIAARVAGFAVLAVVGGVPEISRVDALLAYATAILAYLLQEAVWLLKRQGRDENGATGAAGEMLRGEPASGTDA